MLVAPREIGTVTIHVKGIMGTLGDQGNLHG